MNWRDDRILEVAACDGVASVEEAGISKVDVYG